MPSPSRQLAMAGCPGLDFYTWESVTVMPIPAVECHARSLLLVALQLVICNHLCQPARDCIFRAAHLQVRSKHLEREV